MRKYNHFPDIKQYFFIVENVNVLYKNIQILTRNGDTIIILCLNNIFFFF